MSPGNSKAENLDTEEYSIIAAKHNWNYIGSDGLMIGWLNFIFKAIVKISRLDQLGILFVLKVMRHTIIIPFFKKAIIICDTHWFTSTIRSSFKHMQRHFNESKNVREPS